MSLLPNTWVALRQETPHGMSLRSLLTTTPRSPPCAGTPTRTSISTMRTVWTVRGAGPGVVGGVGLGGHTPSSQAESPSRETPLSRSLLHCPLSLTLSPPSPCLPSLPGPLPTQAPRPTPGDLWMAVLMPRCSGPPARPRQRPLQSHLHPPCSLSAATLAIRPR